MQTEGMEVLVADDDVFLRLDLADRLRRRGFAVFRAGDADQALSITAKRPSIAVVFTDLQMPGSMDGLELLHEVARRWPEKRLVLISGYGHPSSYDMPHGTQFLPKPVSRADLDQVLRNLPKGIVSPS